MYNLITTQAVLFLLIITTWTSGCLCPTLSPLLTCFPRKPADPALPPHSATMQTSSKIRSGSVYASTCKIQFLGSHFTLILSSGRAPVIRAALKQHPFPHHSSFSAHFLHDKSHLIKSYCLLSAPASLAL